MKYTGKSQANLAVLLSFSAGAMAAGNSIEDTHYFRLGMFSQNADISATSVIDPLPPIEIDLTDDLDLDDTSDAIYLNYRWRFKEKWSLHVAYQRLELDGNGSTGFDFNFDGIEFAGGLDVATEFDMDTYLIDVGYSLIRNDKWEVVVGAGIHAFDFETSLTARAELDIDGESIAREGVRANADALAPLPNLRGAVTYMISPRWEVNASIGWLSLEIDDFDGSYTFVDIGTEYRFGDRFGIGATYQIANMNVKVDNSDGFDEVDVEFTGPSIYLSFGF